MLSSHSVIQSNHPFWFPWISVDATEPSVVVRTAVVAPPTCTTQDIVHIVPLLQSFVHNQVVWSHPAISNPDQQFWTWSGLGITVQVHTDSVQDPPADVHDHAVNIPTNHKRRCIHLQSPKLRRSSQVRPDRSVRICARPHDHWTRVAFLGRWTGARMVLHMVCGPSSDVS